MEPEYVCTVTELRRIGRSFAADQGLEIKDGAGGADAHIVRLLERCVRPLVAGALLVSCGSSEAGTAEPLSTTTTIAPTAIAPITPLQFGPIAGFEQGVNELDVPRRVFLIVDGSDVSAFDRKDPNNGCTLFAIDEPMRADTGITDPGAQFFDPCHGYAYDISGRPLCASGNALQPIEIDVVDGIVTWAGMKIEPTAPAAPIGADCPDVVEH